MRYYITLVKLSAQTAHVVNHARTCTLSYCYAHRYFWEIHLPCKKVRSYSQVLAVIVRSPFINHKVLVLVFDRVVYVLI